MRLIKNLRDRLRGNREDRRDKINDAKDTAFGVLALIVVIIGIITVLYITATSHTANNQQHTTITPQAVKQYGKTIVAKVNRVHDGDTLTVDILDWPPIVGLNMPIRINGIDAPEMSSKDPKIKALAIKARDYLKNLLAKGKIIELKNIQRDKYFRLDAELYIDDIDAGSELLKQGLAQKYDGGTKSPWIAN